MDKIRVCDRSDKIMINVEKSNINYINDNLLLYLKNIGIDNLKQMNNIQYESIVNIDFNESISNLIVFNNNDNDNDNDNENDINNDSIVYLLVDITGKNSVYSLLIDNHGRIGLNKLFNSFEDYILEYNKWLTKSENNKLHKFNIYMREKLQLPFHYG